MKRKVGDRFHPDNDELINYYLRNKVRGKDLEELHEGIAEIDGLNHEPWDLPAFSVDKRKDKYWYFFCQLHEYPKRKGAKRLTKAGYWKATGKVHKVSSEETDLQIGYKRILVYHFGRAPSKAKSKSNSKPKSKSKSIPKSGTKPGWVIHEYHPKFDFPNPKNYVIWLLMKKGGKATTANPDKGEAGCSQEKAEGKAAFDDGIGGSNHQLPHDVGNYVAEQEVAEEMSLYSYPVGTPSSIPSSIFDNGGSNHQLPSDFVAEHAEGDEMRMYSFQVGTPLSIASSTFDNGGSYHQLPPDTGNFANVRSMAEQWNMNSYLAVSKAATPLQANPELIGAHDESLVLPSQLVIEQGLSLDDLPLSNDFNLDNNGDQFQSPWTKAATPSQANPELIGAHDESLVLPSQLVIEQGLSLDDLPLSNDFNLENNGDQFQSPWTPEDLFKSPGPGLGVGREEASSWGVDGLPSVHSPAWSHLLLSPQYTTVEP